MKKTTKITLIAAAAAVAGIVLFNLLPEGIRISSMISAGVGLVAGVILKAWWDYKTKK